MVNSAWMDIVCLLSVRFFGIPWTVAHQDSLSMEFSKARILEWVAISSSRDLPDPDIELASPALAGGFFLLLSYLQSPWMRIWMLKCLIDRVKKASIMAAMAIITKVITTAVIITSEKY